MTNFSYFSKSKSIFLNRAYYNRFVELQQKALLPMVIFLQLCCLGKCAGIPKKPALNIEIIDVEAIKKFA